MIEFLKHAVPVFFICGLIVYGLVFFVSYLASVIPHKCWSQNQDDTFDTGAFFCYFCLQKCVSMVIGARTRKYLSMALLVATPLYMLYVMIKAHYTDEINLVDLATAALLCMGTKFIGQEYCDRYPEMDATVPVVAGALFYIVLVFYFRLTVSFVLTSTVLCFFNMTICALQRCVMWAMMTDEFLVNRRLENDSEHNTEVN